MVKKRLIFTLLYSDGSFMLSRNFRLQRVGDAKWLEQNYNFANIATAIDELIILDVSRYKIDTDAFCQTVVQVTQGCFMPLAVGGGITELQQVRRIMESGAEKVVINTAIHRNPDLVREIADIYGAQCIVGSIDYRQTDKGFVPYIDRGTEPLSSTLDVAISKALDAEVGEIYLNSMDRDGTGQGYCLEVLEAIGANVPVPLILAGGAGNHKHLQEGVMQPRVDAVATANLFNFIGDGLPSARSELLEAGVPLARW